VFALIATLTVLEILFRIFFVVSVSLRNRWTTQHLLGEQMNKRYFIKIRPSLHYRIKILSACDSIPMIDLLEKAVCYYMTHEKKLPLEFIETMKESKNKKKS